MRLARLSQRRALKTRQHTFRPLRTRPRSPCDTWRTAARPAWHGCSARLSVRGTKTLTVPGPQLPLVVAAAPASSPLTPANRAPPPRSGDWVVAVWQGPASHAFAPGHYLQVQLPGWSAYLQVRQAINHRDVAMAGAVCPTSTGNCWRCCCAVASASRPSRPPGVATMLELRARRTAVDRGIGFRASPLSLDEAAHFKVTGGALVREVWDGRWQPSPI